MKIDFDLVAKNEKLNDGYYHLLNDLLRYPDATIYIVWSERGPGKTYSALWESYYLQIPMVYIKRTNEDLEFISGNIGDADLSPLVPINRDKGTHLKMQMIAKGIAGFYVGEWDDEKSDWMPAGAPYSIGVSLNAIKSIKGYDASNCEWILLDEFIPQAGEIVKKREGEMLLDLYMTCQRDRLERGKDPQKLILFANAEEISTPITRTLEVVDDMAELNANGKRYRYLADRGILLHHITPEECTFRSERSKMGIYKAMTGTDWAKKSFEGLFANNDFSCVKHQKVNGFKMHARFRYYNKDYYILVRNQRFYVCGIKIKGEGIFYDLEREKDQKAFYLNEVLMLTRALIEGCCLFDRYSLYDLITRFKKIYTI